jgi:hypothetical protein
MNWRCGWSGRAPTLWAQSSEFKCQSHTHTHNTYIYMVLTFTFSSWFLCVVWGKDRGWILETWTPNSSSTTYCSNSFPCCIVLSVGQFLSSLFSPMNWFFCLPASTKLWLQSKSSSLFFLHFQTILGILPSLHFLVNLESAKQSPLPTPPQKRGRIVWIDEVRWHWVFQFMSLK